LVLLAASSLSAEITIAAAICRSRIEQTNAGPVCPQSNLLVAPPLLVHRIPLNVGSF